MTIHFNYPEGATPIQDCSGLKPAWIRTQKDLNRAEAENISVAQKIYLRKPIDNPLKWFEVTSLKKIHRDMFSNVWEWAGKNRETITVIGIEPYLITARLAELCDEIKFWLTQPVELTFLEQAARIHHKLVHIHPFTNGNGRFSRLIADRYLMFWGCLYPEWPIDLQGNGLARSEYINCLKSADQGDYNPLINFMKILGAKDPSLSEFLGLTIYKTKLNNSQRLASVKALLRMDNNINDIKNKGQHPLHLSINNNEDDIFLFLVEHKADIKFRDRSGYDPFELTISKSKLKLAHALYEAGYPYKKGSLPPTKLLNYYAQLYEFDMELK